MSEQEKDHAKDVPSSVGNVSTTGSATIMSTDEHAARKLYVLDQLTTLYGFDPRIAEEAIEAAGLDAEACCSFILDNNLAKDQGGPVVPIDHCPHLTIKINKDSLPPLPQATACSHENTEKCTGQPKATTDKDGQSCPSTSENWICLECGVIRCGRYVNAHAKAHFESSGHCTAISLTDLSAWCYHCQAYIVNRDNSTLGELLEELEMRKFQQGLSRY